MKKSIDDLIVRSKHQRLRRAEAEWLDRWRAAAPENDDHYRAVESILDAMAEAPSPSAGSKPPPVATILARGEGRARRRTPRFSLAVVSFGGLAVAGLLLFLLLRPAAVELPAGSLQLVDTGEYVTDEDAPATLMLWDGTVVRLAPGGRLRVGDSTGPREVELEGRAYFAVTGQPDNPFRIITPTGEAVVLGTRFEVDSRSGFEVLVVEGEVEVRAEGDTVGVRGSELAQAAGRSLVKSRLDEEAVARHLAWLDGLLVFQDTPMGQAAVEIERRFDLQVNLAGDGLAEETVRGVFLESEPLEQIVDALCLALSAACTVDENAVTVRR